MENVQKPKVGAGIKILSIIQLVINGIGLLGLIASLFMKEEIKNQLKTAGVPLPTTAALIISMALIIILIMSVILILMKKELGIYIYFTAVVANIVYAIVSTGFNPGVLLNLIVPVLMGFFIWKKKEIFSPEAKSEQIDI